MTLDATKFEHHERGLPVSDETLAYLLSNRLVQRIITLMDVSSLSTLELLEYGVTKADIRFSFINGIIELDPRYASATPDPSIVSSIVDGKYDFWNSRKFRLSELGLFLLGCQDSCYPREMMRAALS